MNLNHYSCNVFTNHLLQGLGYTAGLNNHYLIHYQTVFVLQQPCGKKGLKMFLGICFWKSEKQRWKMMWWEKKCLLAVFSSFNQLFSPGPVLFGHMPFATRSTPNVF